MQDHSLDSTEPSSAEEITIGEEMSGLAKVLNTLVLILLLAVAGSFVWLMSSLPRIEGRVPVVGIQLPAQVARDHYGVPRITARSVRDAYFALGYVHAQDRLWQMEMQRRVGAGRLAEVVGEAGLSNDRFMRTLGLYRLAEQSFERQDKPTRDALAAYAEGVNSFIDTHRHRLPLEFVLLGVRPEPWRPADSLVWGRLMALQLTGNWRDEVLKVRLGKHLDPARIGDLFPDYPAGAPATLDHAAAGGLLDALPDQAAPRLASNVWAIAGSLSASGKPLLANDPHLGFQAPIQWYLASVDAPGLSVSGATIPGLPFHLIGHTARVAWGTTTTHADTVDLFVETADPDRMRSREEVILVKDAPEERLVVRETANGPVVSDLLAPGLAPEGKVVAFRATALEPDDLTAQAFYKINRAADWKSFNNAVADFNAPVQNFAVADADGTIGFVTAGRIPVRAGGADGSMPVDAKSGRGVWTGWIPPSSMPRVVNPPSGRIVNANNKVHSRHLLAWHWPEHYRAQRIEDRLGMDGYAARDMALLQMDHLSLAAVDILGFIGTLEPTTPLAREAALLLAEWDGTMDKHRPEPLIFAAWMDRLWADLFAGPLGEDFRSFRAIRPYVLKRVFSTARHWCGPEAACEDLARKSLEAAVSEVASRRGASIRSWKWGDEHKAAFRHAVLGRLPVLSRLTTVTVPTFGDDFTVNRGTYAPGGFEHVHGAGLRAVYDLADLAGSRFAMPTGQSGNVLSRHYNDLTSRWADNDGLVITGRPPDSAVLTLEPAQ